MSGLVASRFGYIVFVSWLMLGGCSKGDSPSGDGNSSNSNPHFTSSVSTSAMENQTGTGYTATATDADNDSVSFAISGGVDQAFFTINPSTGVLAFLSAPDFENPGDSNQDNDYQVQLSVSDGKASDSLSVTVTVTDDPSDNIVNNAPVFSSGTTTSAMENQTGTNYTATATDADNDSLSFAISGGADQAFFTINPITGVLAFLSAPDFEIPGDSNQDNDYQVQLSVSDGKASDSLSVIVTVTDDPSDNIVNNAPVFSSGTTTSAMENQTGTNYTATATDADNDSVSFAISGGADQAFFTINPITGVLAFLSAPDFEIPGDSNQDNDYQVQLSVNDGKTSVYLTVTVTVTDDISDNINNAPAYTGAKVIIVDENQTDTLYRAIATDADGDSLTYSISGGADQAFFSVPSPLKPNGQRAMPFWSSLSRTEKIIKTVPAYSVFVPLEITWEAFEQVWAPDLSKNGILIGVNWSGNNATGYDLKAEDVIANVMAQRDENT